MPSTTTRTPRPRGRGGKAETVNAVTADPNKPRVCFKMRDTGSCDKGAQCPFSHDARILAEARCGYKEFTDHTWWLEDAIKESGDLYDALSAWTPRGRVASGQQRPTNFPS